MWPQQMHSSWLRAKKGHCHAWQDLPLGMDATVAALGGLKSLTP